MTEDEIVLARHFPGETEGARRAAARSPHFRRLVAELALLDRRIARAEDGSEPAPSLHLEAMRRTRLSILEALALILRDAAADGR